MNLTEKIKYINQGMRLQRYVDEVENCRNLTGGKRGQGAEKRIYAGTEDYVEFFETVISTLGLDVKYEIEDVDGELELVVF